MGISTAPDEYQACIEKIFGDLDFVVVYLDDILVYSSSEKTHLKHLGIVFKRLKMYDVTLNGKKCHILRESVDYLGFTLTSEGIQPQQTKIQAIQQIAVPKPRRELRRFLGMQQNSKRLEHFYNAGDHVMMRISKQFRAKLDAVDKDRF
ncbi:unnamed protein product [Peronospora farinosa]|uniref:Reverse transcriptase domain-containing protein n=1 Tax=Peronospora farinosa TaxID=134698 RepID=A0ABN8C7G7_9STRA|nr:unnamed protein product [Peronospora farinosa]